MAQLEKSDDKKVVAIAVDSSEFAEYAFDWYGKNFHRPNMQVLCVHVPEGFDIEKAQKELVRGGSMKESTEKQYSKITELEERYQHKMHANNMRGTVLSVPSKAPGQTILETAREEKAFCIVMGTRGRSAIKKALLGSVSDYLIKNADIPVIVVRKKKEDGEN